MAASTPPQFLRRYTDLPALLHLLRTRTITLLDPGSWDDRNDAAYLALYKEKKALTSLLALCFAQVPETYHHWRVFAGGQAGVCIIFDRARLLTTLKAVPGITAARVKYAALTAARTRTHPLRVRELPFLKRIGFKPEGEFRVIHESATATHATLPIPLALECIRSISLSPWLHNSLKEATVATLRSVEGCGKLHISRSTLISNEQWKTFAQQAL
jgi:hypothetical protein